MTDINQPLYAITVLTPQQESNHFFHQNLPRDYPLSAATGGASIPVALSRRLSEQLHSLLCPSGHQHSTMWLLPVSPGDEQTGLTVLGIELDSTT